MCIDGPFYKLLMNIVIKKLNFEYFLTESVNFVQSSSSEMIKFYLVSELILLDINQKYFKCKKCFSMDNSFTKKCCNHNQIDTMNKHHVFYGQCRKSRECLWNLNLDVVYTDNMMNIPIIESTRKIKTSFCILDYSRIPMQTFHFFIFS